ncbi:MAG: hypothetical protein K1X94_17370 [Sandaracinaceae bacterium]|nr:hypothetical protein [Sandaracinaceae bacterium]
MHLSVSVLTRMNEGLLARLLLACALTATPSVSGKTEQGVATGVRIP